MSQCGCFFLVNGQPRYLPQVKIDIHTTIVNTTSKTFLTQQFINPSKENPIDEINYMFPLYDGVSVVKFTCTLADRIIKGVAKERHRARFDYTKAKAEGKTAGLLEQSFQASDVFSTTIGNVSAGGKVVVEIVYIGELKHDAETDQVRLTIPTSIAPRYGYSAIDTKGTQFNDEGISMTVDVEMPQGSFIESLTSPSHPIAVSIGTLSTTKASSERTLNKASAVLSHPQTSLNHDFVVEIAATGLNEPTVCLETHPTIPNQRALMATLVPKFKFPVVELPEIIFLCDRSGSMQTKIKNLIVSLTTFLKSLPVGIKFNIYSFGSSYTSLWPRSRTYDQETLGQAMAHIHTFQANYGGTEIFTVMDAAFKNSFKDLNLEVFLLTDGEIWDQNRLFELINNQMASNQARIRVFSLGIGSGASSALIEGVARAGNGFAQIVSDNERMDTKVIRMLRGALLPHINSYSLEIKYESSSDCSDEEHGFEIIERVMDSLQIRTEPETKSTRGEATTSQTISLYDPDFNTEDENIGGSNLEMIKAEYDHLPTIETPRYLQTPAQIPPLYPFSRTTIYVLLSESTPEKSLKSVLLKAVYQDTTLELEIPIVHLPEKSSTIHQLAARSEIKDLEEGRGWLSRATDVNGKLLRHKFDGKFSDMVEREAARLGVKFQVAGKHCSFVAIEEPTSDGSGGLNTELDEPKQKRMKIMYAKQHIHASSNASISLLRQGRSAHQFSSMNNTIDMDSFPMDFGGPLSMGSDSIHTGDVLNDFDFDSFLHDDGSNQPFDFNGEFSPDLAGTVSEGSQREALPLPTMVRIDDPHTSGVFQSLDTGRLDRLHILISLQTFTGTWAWDQNLEKVLGISIHDPLRVNLPISAVSHVQKDEIIATSCAIMFLEKQYSAERESWELLVAKASHWLQEQIGGDVELLKTAIERFF